MKYRPNKVFRKDVSTKETTYKKYKKQPQVEFDQNFKNLPDF